LHIHVRMFTNNVDLLYSLFKIYRVILLNEVPSNTFTFGSG